MELVMVGLGVMALTSYAWWREVKPAYRKLMRKRNPRLTDGPRVRTIINIKEKH